METIKSDVDRYVHKVVHDNGNVTYYNEIKASDELNRIMSRCWDSLPAALKIQINKEVV